MTRIINHGRAIVLALLAVSLVGCPTGTDDDDTNDDDDAGQETPLPPPEDVVLNGSCDLADKYGRFAVEETVDYTTVHGQVADGVVPVTVLRNIQEEGGCRLLRRENPFCDPTCLPGFTCDYDGECIDFPAEQDLGTAYVRGLVEDVAMEPVQPGFNYFVVGLPQRAIVAGETIQLRTTGGRWDGFELWGVGVESFSLPDGLLLTIAEATPLELEWPAPAADARSEVEFRLNIDEHGTSPVTLICSFPDTGSASVPATMIDGLRGVGVTGWPSGSLTRQTVDKIDLSGGEGCVEFVVAVPRPVAITVSGFIPCNRMNPCPKGMVCNEEIELCQ
jgi:hypothetical protein